MLYEVIENIMNNRELCDLSKYDTNNVSKQGGDHYYQFFAVYARLYNIQHFLEIGTREGDLAKIMLDFVPEITTIDVNYRYFRHPDMAKKPNVHMIQAIHYFHCLELDYNKYDMIFMDVDHEGVIEPIFHQKLIDTNYKGIVFYDDIFWDKMYPFWKSIKLPKITLDWNAKGQGAVLYG